MKGKFSKLMCSDNFEPTQLKVTKCWPDFKGGWNKQKSRFPPLQQQPVVKEKSYFTVSYASKDKQSMINQDLCGAVLQVL